MNIFGKCMIYREAILYMPSSIFPSFCIQMITDEHDNKQILSKCKHYLQIHVGMRLSLVLCYNSYKSCQQKLMHGMRSNINGENRDVEMVDHFLQLDKISSFSDKIDKIFLMIIHFQVEYLTSNLDNLTFVWEDIERKSIYAQYV